VDGKFSKRATTVTMCGIRAIAWTIAAAFTLVIRTVAMPLEGWNWNGAWQRHSSLSLGSYTADREQDGE